jgi:MraZ protein
MALFLSTFQNRIDKKGRISVPASFRGVLVKEDFAGIIAYSSFVNPCIEACGMARIHRLSESIDALDPFSSERDAFATSILGGSVQLAFDSEGRVTLPESLLITAHITEEAAFVGKGETFEIWNPKELADYASKARDLAKTKRATLQLKQGSGV